MELPQRISLDGDDWHVQGWVPHEWDLVGPVHLATGGLDLSTVMHGETPKIPATVPGCVQADLLRAGLIEEPYFECNSRLCEWAHQRMWTYERNVPLPAEWSGCRVRLRFDGIDYSARVFLNGELIGSHAGMFVPAIFDVTDAVRFGADNLLQVAVEPAPASVGQVGHTTAVRAIKPRFAYKWDFATRLIPLGLWEGVWLEATGPVAINEAWAHATPNGSAARAIVHVSLDAAEKTEIRAETTIELDGERLFVETSDPVVVEGRRELSWEVGIPDPKLWWPHGHGRQPIYTAQIAIADADGDALDAATATFGIRKVEMVPNADSPAGARSYTFVINGRKLFLKGYNWVPIEQMYGTASAEKYAWMIDLARKANANLLRVWGGGLIEKEVFYTLCDRAGMLVWQEMPQSSSALDNEPSADAAFVAEMEHTARSAIRRRGGHPSLVIWGGGNELTAAGEMPLKPLDETHPCLAAIGRAAAEEHPNLLYVPTSPLGPSFDVDLDAVGEGVHHDVHGPWKYAGVKDHYAFFNANDCLFHGETGTDGCCAVRSMRRFARPEQLWPPEPSNRLWCHHAAWWIPGEAIRRLFGPIEDMPTFVKASQALQAESLRYAVEANRRRSPRCSATLIWQFNEPWPNLACTSNVDYYGLPKPAYDSVRRAFAPRHVSLRHDGIVVDRGSAFAADVFVHNDDPAAWDAAVDWRLCNAAGDVLADGSWKGKMPPAGCEQVGRIEWPVPAELDGPLFVILELRCGDDTPLRNTYAFCPAGDPPLAPLLAMPHATLELADARRAGDAAVVTARNAGGAVAWLVRAEAGGEDAVSFCPANGVTLLPGEAVELAVEVPPGAPAARGVSVSAFNAGEVQIETQQVR